MNEITRSWSERERKRETHAHNQKRDSDWKKAREKEEEPWRKRMLHHSVTKKSRLNSLSVKNWFRYHTHLRRALRSIIVAWEREKERVGWGLGEQIRELVVLLASEEKSERARGKESERQGERKRERPTTARRRNNEEGRKTKKELWRERAREMEIETTETGYARKRKG